MPTVRATFPGWPGRERATLTNDNEAALMADLEDLDRQYGEWKQGQATQARAKENLKALPANEPYANEEDKPSLASMAIMAPVSGLKRLPGVALGMLGAAQQTGAGVGSLLGRSIGGETLFGSDPLDQTDPNNPDPRAQFQNVGQSDQEFALQQPVTRGLGPDKGKAKPLFTGKGFGEVPITGAPLSHNGIDLTEEARFWNEFRRGPQNQEEYKAWLASRSLAERISPIEANPDGILPYRLNMDAFRNATDALESLPEMGGIALATAYGSPAAGLGLGAALGAGHAGEANLNLQDKQRMIANPEQQGLSVGAGVLSGLSESLPIGHMLGGASKVASPLRRVATGFGEEAIQEAGSKVLEDAASADPEQQINLSDPTAYLGQLLETGLKAGLMGGGFAGAVDAAPAIVRERKAGKALKELQGIAHTPADIVDGVDGTQGMQPVDMSVPPPADTGQPAPDPAQQAQAQLAELKGNWEAMMRGESTATFFPAGAPVPNQIPQNYSVHTTAAGMLVYDRDTWPKGVVRQAFSGGPEGIAQLTQRSKPKAAAPAPAPTQPQAQAAPPPPLIQPQAQAPVPTSGTNVPSAVPAPQQPITTTGKKLKPITWAEPVEPAPPQPAQDEAARKAAHRRAVVEKHLAQAQANAPKFDRAADDAAMAAPVESDPLLATAQAIVAKSGPNLDRFQRELKVGNARAVRLLNAVRTDGKPGVFASFDVPPATQTQQPQAPTVAPADIIEGVDGTQGMQPVDMPVAPAPLVKPARAPKDARQDKRLFDVRKRAAGKVLPPEGPPPPPEAPRPTKPLASRAQVGVTQTRTASVEDTERVLEIARRAFPGFDFKSIDDISQASPETQAEAAKGAPGKAWIEGNTATVLRTANESAQDVATQILHEVGGHKAVELALASGEKGDTFHKSLMKSEWGRKAMQKWVEEWHGSYEIDKSIPLEKQSEKALDLIANETIAKLIERKLADPNFKTPPWYAGVRATARHRLASWRDAFSTSNGKPLADWYVNSLSEKDIDGLLLKGLRQARRGASVGPAGADDDPDFSRAKRRQKDLLATHGISGERLFSILKDHDGLFPAPSIAITRGAEIPSAYGGWKIIFPPDTINPDREFKGATGKIERPNKVYGADAYSPMVESDDMPGTREHRELLEDLEKVIGSDGKLNGKAVFAIGAIVKKGGTAHFTSNHNLRVTPTPHGIRYTVETREHTPDEFGDPQPGEVLNGFTYTYPSDGFVDIANRITSEIRTTLIDNKGARNTISSVIKKKSSQGMSLARKKPDEYDDGGIQGAKLISQQPLRTMQQVIEYSKKALPGASTAEDAFRGDKTNETKIQLARDGAWIRRKADAYGGGINGVKRVVAALRGAMSDFDSRNDEDEWYDLTEGRSKSVAFAMQHPMYPDPLHVAAHSEADGVHVRIYDSHGSIGSAVLPAKAGSKALKAAVTNAAARGVDPAYYVKAWEFIRDYPTTLLEATPVRAVDIREAKAVVVTKQAAARQPELVEMLRALGIPVEIVGSGANIGAPRTSEIDRVARERKLYFSRGKDKLPSGDPGDPGWSPARPATEADVETGEPTDSMSTTDPNRYTNWEAKQRAAGQTEEPAEEHRPGRMWDPSWEEPGQKLRDAEVAAELARGTGNSELGPLRRTGREFEKSEYQKEIDRRTKLREEEAELGPMRQINPNTYAPSRPDGDPSPSRVSPKTPERVSDREVSASNRWTPEQLERAKAAKDSGQLTERERRPRMPLDPAEESANDTKRTSPVRMLDANKEIYNALKGNVVGRAVASTDETDIDTTKQAIDPEFEPREARAGFGMVDYDMVSDEIAREIQQLIDSHQPGAEVRGVKPGQTGVIALPHGGKAVVGVARREPLKADVKFYNDKRGPLRAGLDTIVRSVARGPAEAFANLTFSVDGTTFYRAEIRPSDYGKDAEDSFEMVVIDFLSEDGKTLYGTAEFDAGSGILRDDILEHAAYHIKEAGGKLPGGATLTITGRGGIEATASLDEALAAEEAERQKDEEERAKEKSRKPNPWAWDIDPKEHAELLIDAAARKFLEAAQADAVEAKGPPFEWTDATGAPVKKHIGSSVLEIARRSPMVSLVGFNLKRGENSWRVFLEHGDKVPEGTSSDASLTVISVHELKPNSEGRMRPQKETVVRTVLANDDILRRARNLPEDKANASAKRMLEEAVFGRLELLDETDADSDLEALPKREIWPDGYENDPAKLGQTALETQDLLSLPVNGGSCLLEPGSAKVTVNAGPVPIEMAVELFDEDMNRRRPAAVGQDIAEIIWRGRNDIWRVKENAYNDDRIGHYELDRRLRQAKSLDGALGVSLSSPGKYPSGVYSAFIEIDPDNEVDISIHTGATPTPDKVVAHGTSVAKGGKVLAAINDLMRGLGLTPDSEPKKSKKKDPNRIVRFSRGRVPSQSEIDAEREAGSVDADKDRAGITTEKDETLREEKEFPIDSIRRREMTRQKVKDWYAEADERLNTPQKLAAETKRLLKIAKDHYASAYNERGRRTLTWKTETLEPADVKLMQRVADFMDKAWEDSGHDPEIGADLNLLTMASKDLAGEHGRILNAHKNLSKSPADMARTMLRDLLLGPEEKQAAPVDAAVKLTGLESQTSLLKKKLVDKALAEIQTIAAQVTELREALKTPMPEMKPLQPAGKGPGKGPGAGKGSDPAQLSPAQAGQVLTGPGGKKITRRQAQAELNSLEDRLVRLLKVTKGMPPGKLSPEQRGALAVAEIARIKKDHGIDLASWTDADWEDTPQVLSLMRGLAADKATPMDRAYEWWLNAILSGISTQAVNVTSNLMFNIYEEGVRALRTGIKAASGSDAHDADADYLLSVWGGMARSIPRAWSNAVWAWSNEASKFGHDATKWDERQIRTAIHGKFGRVVRGFGVRQLLAGDEFFKTIIGEGEAAGNAYGIAKDEAAKKKLKPKSAEYNKFLEKRMREMIEDLASPAWTGEVTTEVNRRTFQADLHDVWQLVARARNMTPGARWIVPFITTPINVLIEGMRAVPLVDPAMEFTKATVKNKSAKAGLAAVTNADTLARQSMSLAFLMFLVAGDEPDEKGMSMVEGPSEAGRNRALREWEVGMSKPQTIALPGTKNRLDYSRVEPAATAIGMTASLARNIRDAIAGRKQPSVAAASVMSAFWRQMQDKTMLKGLTDATRAFKPEEGDSTWGARMAQWVGRFAGSFVPKAATQWYVRPDDEIREGDLWGAKKTGDVDRESPLVKAGRNVRASLLPSEDNPRVDPWGVNVQRDSVSAGAADPFLTPFGIVRGSALSVREPGRGKPEMIKEIDDLFARYNAKHPDAPLSPARPQKSIELRNKQGIKYKAYLTDDEYEEYSRLHGETRQEVFKSAMAALRKNVEILPDVLESANKAANEKAKAVWTRKLMTEKK